MNKSLLEIYALSICFVSVGCMSIFGGVLLFSLVELFLPTPVAFPPIHYPPPIYMQNGAGTVSVNPELTLPRMANQTSKSNSDVTNDIDINTKKIEEQQKRFEAMETERMKVESTRSIIRYIIILLVASFVFTFHWRMAKRVRTNNDT